MKYFELGHEPCVRARGVEQKSTRSKWNIPYAGPDLSDEIYCCAGVYILGIHDVCSGDSGTATCNARVSTKDSHMYARVPTCSSLTVYKNIAALVNFCLYERYRGDQMLEHVSFLHIVQGNLVPGEGLQSTRPQKMRYRSA